jgi:hypothetical protein
LKKSAEEHCKELLRPSLFSVVIDNFKKYALQILLCISSLILILYFTLKYSRSELYGSNAELFKEIYSIGLAIFSSGIFLAVLKWFQFNGFFREELHGIIKSSAFEENLKTSFAEVLQSDEFLKKQKDLPDLWKRVNRALFENEFTKEIADNIELKMQELFFRNKKLSHHYRNMVITLTISRDKNNFVTIREISESKIVRANEKKFKFDFTFYILKDGPTDNTSNVTIREIKVGGKAVNLGSVETENTTQKLTKKLWVELEGSTEYQVYTDTTMQYKLDVDREYIFYAERFIDNLRLDMQYSDNVEVIFTPLSAEDFDDIPAAANHSTKVYNNILLPDKGFRLIFVSKN